MGSFADHTVYKFPRNALIQSDYFPYTSGFEHISDAIAYYFLNDKCNYQMKRV